MRRVANFRNYDPLTNPWLVKYMGFRINLRGLSEPELADMEAFLDEVLLILPVLGVSDFQLRSIGHANDASSQGPKYCLYQ